MSVPLGGPISAMPVTCRSSRRLFELTPEPVSMPQQRDIRGMLEVSQSNDTRAAMGGAAIVAGCITLDAEHPLASARHVLDRRAAHRTQAADDDIEMRHSAGPTILSPTVAIVMARSPR